MLRIAPLACFLLLTGCAEAERPQLAKASPALRPELFFAGRTTGVGVLELMVGETRRLRVESTGTPVGAHALRIDQVIRYDDGEVDRRSWTVRRGPDGRYGASLSEAKGPVRIVQAGNSVNIRYSFGSPRVRMDQWLYLRSDGRTLDNRAAVTLAGVTVARLRETITKDEGAADEP